MNFSAGAQKDRIRYFSESKNDSIISNFSRTSKNLTNYTTYNNAIKKKEILSNFLD